MHDVEPPPFQDSTGIEKERLVLGPRVQFQHGHWDKVDFAFQFVVNRFTDDRHLMPQALQSAKKVDAVPLGTTFLQRTVTSDKCDVHGNWCRALQVCQAT